MAGAGRRECPVGGMENQLRGQMPSIVPRMLGPLSSQNSFFFPYWLFCLSWVRQLPGFRKRCKLGWRFSLRFHFHRAGSKEIVSGIMVRKSQLSHDETGEKGGG